MAEERTERVREEAKRIASQILVLTRNGLFVSLRFLDLALCQFEYLSTDKMKGIATTGQHIVYNSQYVIESYMKDRQALFEGLSAHGASLYFPSSFRLGKSE